MSNSPLQPSDTQGKQWYILGLVTLWLLLSFITPIVAFCLTSNPLCFIGCIDIAPPARLLYLLGNRIYPPGDNETKIAIEKHKKRRIP